MSTENIQTVFINNLSDFAGAKLFIIEGFSMPFTEIDGIEIRRNSTAYSNVKSKEKLNAIISAIKEIRDAGAWPTKIKSLVDELNSLGSDEWVVVFSELTDEPLPSCAIAHVANKPGENLVAVITPEVQYGKVEIYGVKTKLRNYPPIQKVENFKKEYSQLVNKHLDSLKGYYQPEEPSKLFSPTQVLSLTDSNNEMLKLIEGFMKKLDEPETSHHWTEPVQAALSIPAAICEILVEVNALGGGVRQSND